MRMGNLNTFANVNTYYISELELLLQHSGSMNSPTHSVSAAQERTLNITLTLRATY